MKFIKQLLIVLGIAGMASFAAAQTTNIILLTDFDNDAGLGNFGFSYGYAAVGSSAGTVAAGFSGGITGAAGGGGTFSNSITPDYPLLPSNPNWPSPSLTYVYAVLGNGTEFIGTIAPITPTAVMAS